MNDGTLRDQEGTAQGKLGVFAQRAGKAHKENTGDKYGADLVKEVSSVAWQHINLYGRYEFREQPAPVDVEEIVRVLADIQIETDSSLAA